jgi:2-oxoisovalerate dehydrogenase E1 component alpha subunit
MLTVSVVDQILNSLQRQGRISFYMTGLGEEAAQVGSAAALDKMDVVWPQYRELGCFMYRGFTIQQVVDQCMSRHTDPGKGRQMPVHYCDVDLQMQAVTSPLATQIPQVAGAGYAFRIGKEDRCAVAYCGDGSASEGDFAVGLNFAATLKAQTIFLCRNNGWAISTDVREQYAGDGVAARGPAYGMNTIRADGNDLAAVYTAVKMARDHCVQAGEPVMVEMMTYRAGHHSTSDDSSKYRPGQEVKTMSRSGLEPISRMRLLLQDEGRWTEDEEKTLRDAVKEEVMTALKLAEAKKFAPISDMFEDVYASPPPLLQRQRQELEEHLRRHKDKYPSLKTFQES